MFSADIRGGFSVFRKRALARTDPTGGGVSTAVASPDELVFGAVFPASPWTAAWPRLAEADQASYRARLRDERALQGSCPARRPRSFEDTEAPDWQLRQPSPASV